MKKNETITRSILPQLSPEEWNERIERYYEGLTNAAEERELEAFLFSQGAADSRYEEHRAVMSYLAIGKRYHTASQTGPLEKQRSLPARKTTKRWVAAAAIALLLIGTGVSLQLNYARNNIYVAYVNGKKYTSPEVVKAQIQQSFDEVAGGEVSVAQELTEMFSDWHENIPNQ